jgi:DNA modification methylase
MQSRSANVVTATDKLEQYPLGQLKPYPNNARTHSPGQIKQIARSIERFGFVNPILVDATGQIIAGHGRCEAAKRLGLKSVPVVRIEHLSPAEIRAYALADNRLAEKAGWDQEILAIELQGLIDLDFDVELTGFEMGEIDIILDTTPASQGTDDVADLVPAYEPKCSITRPGDLWVLGQHRLRCSDALADESYRTLMDGDTARFVLTDPPYNLKIENNVSGLGRIRHKDFAMASGEMSKSGFTDFLEAAFRQLASHTVDGSIHQVFMDWRHLEEIMAAGRKVYSELKNLIVWVKTNGGMGTFYRGRHELLFAWKKGAAPHVNNFEPGQFGRSRTNVWEYAGVNSFGSERLEQLAAHPTCKPVAMLADAIRDCSRRGDLVLDPFAGSGSLLIAAERTGRKARLLEIDPHYCDVIVRRWQTVTGKRAIHAASNLSFDELEDQVDPAGGQHEAQNGE